MAKSGEIQLVISAVSDQAKKELDKLTGQYNKLVAEQEKLTVGTEAFGKKSAEIDKVKTAMSQLATQIETGNITSLERLSKAEKAAERELRKMVEGTEDYVKAAKKLEEVRQKKDELKKSISDIGKETEKATGGIKGFASGAADSLKGLAPLGAAAIGAFAVDKLLQFGKGAISAFNEAENAAFQMHNAMVVLGGETEETFQRLMDQADMLEQTTFGFSAEQIQNTQKELKQFGLMGDEIEKLTPKILDYATATGKDLATATVDVTNAMLGNDKALQKVGISLDSSQQSVQGVTNSLDKFAGTATSALDVGTNKLEVMSDKWGKFEELVGEFLVNVGFKLIEWFTPVAEGLSDIWAVLVRVYDVFQESIAPIKAWFGEMATSYPWLNKVKDAIVAFFTPLSQLGNTLKLVGTYWQMLVAGAIAGTKTIRDIWGEFGTYASDIWGGIGDVVGNVFSGNFSKVGASVDALKAKIATAGGDIANTFVANYEAEMAKFKAVPDASSGASGPIKDRKIKDPEADAAAKKAATEAKKEQDKAAKEAEDAAQKQVEIDKKANEERIKIREAYFKRLSEANKVAEDSKIASIKDDFEREKALLAQKETEELAKVAELEKELTDNKAISEEERAVLMQKYAEIRLNISQNTAKSLLELEVEHQNDLNKAESEAWEKRLERENQAKRTMSEIAILQAKDEFSLINAKIQKILTERDIELQNEELTADQKTLIREKAQKDIEAIEQEAAANRQKRLDDETKQEESAAKQREDLRKASAEAAINITQAGIDALLQFSQMETDKKVAGFEAEKDARTKRLDEQFKKGLLSEKAYNKQKEAIEKDLNEKIAAEKTKQAKKDKAAAIIQAAINTAVAVTAGMASPAIPPFPSAIAAGIVGALQIALIAAKPLPTFQSGGVFGKKAGIPQGPSHAQGGINLIDGSTGQVLGQMEGNEPYMILSGATYQNNKGIVDELLYSSLYRNGAKVYESGGVFGRTPMTTIPQGAGTTAVLDLNAVVVELRALRSEVAMQRTQLRAYITYQDLEQANTEVNNIRSKAKR